MKEKEVNYSFKALHHSVQLFKMVLLLFEVLIEVLKCDL